jgi:hypothetical protein
VKRGKIFFSPDSDDAGIAFSTCGVVTIRRHHHMRVGHFGTIFLSNFENFTLRVGKKNKPILVAILEYLLPSNTIIVY